MHTSHHCAGCGFTTYNLPVYHRHILRCIFRKKMLKTANSRTTLANDESTIQANGVSNADVSPTNKSQIKGANRRKLGFKTKKYLPARRASSSTSDCKLVCNDTKPVTEASGNGELGEIRGAKKRKTFVKSSHAGKYPHKYDEESHGDMNDSSCNSAWELATQAASVFSDTAITAAFGSITPIDNNNRDIEKTGLDVMEADLVVYKSVNARNTVEQPLACSSPYGISPGNHRKAPTQKNDSLLLATSPENMSLMPNGDENKSLQGLYVDKMTNNVFKSKTVGAPPNRARKRLYKCKKCPFETKQSKDFLQHKMTSHAARLQMIYQCMICNYASVTKSKVVRHVNAVHTYTGQAESYVKVIERQTQIELVAIDKNKKDTDQSFNSKKSLVENISEIYNQDNLFQPPKLSKENNNDNVFNKDSNAENNNQLKSMDYMSYHDVELEKSIDKEVEDINTSSNWFKLPTSEESQQGRGTEFELSMHDNNNCLKLDNNQSQKLNTASEICSEAQSMPFADGGLRTDGIVANDTSLFNWKTRVPKDWIEESGHDNLDGFSSPINLTLNKNDLDVDKLMLTSPGRISTNKPQLACTDSENTLEFNKSSKHIAAMATMLSNNMPARMGNVNLTFPTKQPEEGSLSDIASSYHGAFNNDVYNGSDDVTDKSSLLKSALTNKIDEYDFDKYMMTETKESHSKGKEVKGKKHRKTAENSNNIKVLPGLGTSPVFGCTLCRFTHPQKSKVFNHLTQAHNHKVKKSLHFPHFNCKLCDFVCSRKTEWAAHKITHSSKRRFSCKECTYQTTCYRNFTRHMCHHERSALEVGGLIKCNYCSYTSTGEGAVQRHMREFHHHLDKTNKEINNISNTNEPSDFKFPVDYSVKYSVIDTPVQSASIPRNPFISKKISPKENDHGKFTDNSTNMSEPYVKSPVSEGNQIESELSNGGDFFCYEHDESTVFSVLKINNNITPEKSSYNTLPTVPIGDYTSPVDGKVEPFNCPHCDFKAKTGSQIKSHLVIHSDQHPFICSLCNFKYKRSSDLKRHHRQKHSGNNPESKPGSDYNPLSTPESLQQHYNAALYESDSPLPSSGGLIETEDNLVKNPELIGIDNNFVRIEAGFSPTLNTSVLDFMNIEMSSQNDSIGTNGLTGRTSTVTMADHLASDERIVQNIAPLNLTSQTDGGGEEITDYDDSEVSFTVATPIKVLLRPEAFKCKQCSYNAKFPADLRRHMVVHSINKKFKCTLCTSRFKYRGDLNKHLRNIHKLAIGRKRKNKFEVEAVGGHDGKGSKAQRKNFKGKVSKSSNALGCGETGKSSKTGSNVTGNASAGSKIKRSSAAKPWACLFCDFRCMIRDDIKDHLQYNHEESVIQYGDIEHLVDQTYSLITAKTNSPKKNDDGTWQCPYCPFIGQCKKEMNRHIEVHGNLRRYLCPVCGRRSNWVWDIRKHIRKLHPSSALDVVQLSEEEARATLTEYLSSRISSSKDKSKANMSSDQLEKQSNLSSSFKSPTNENAQQQKLEVPYYKQNLTPEERIRPYMCSCCRYRSNWKQDIVRHVRLQKCPAGELIVLSPEEARTTLADCIHNSGGRGRKKKKRQPVVTGSTCAVIKMSGVKSDVKKSNAAMMSTVKKMVTNRNRPFKCSVCERRSNWKWDLNKHIRTHHPGVGQLIILSEAEAKKPFAEQAKHKPLKPGKQLSIKSLFAKSPHMDSSRRLSTGSTPEAGDGSCDLGNRCDKKRLKRFKCSECFTRSNYKGDIQRHLKRIHANAPGAYVESMDVKEAEATLDAYNAKYIGNRSLERRHFKSKTLPTPLSGVDLLRAVRSRTPDGTASTASDTASPDWSSRASEEERQPYMKLLYSCKECQFWCGSRKAIEDHCSSHLKDGTPMYTCRLCGKKSDFWLAITRHLRRKHKRLELESYDQLVKFCGIYTVNGRKPSQSHMADSEESLDPASAYTDELTAQDSSHRRFSCSICKTSKTSSFKYSITRHIKVVHLEITEDFDRYVSDSGPAGKTEPLTQVKVKVETNQLKYKRENGLLSCTVCPYTTSKRTSLDIHFSYHTPQPGHKFTCRHCPYYVAQAGLLHRHIRLHLQQQGLLPSPDNSPVKSQQSQPRPNSHSRRTPHLCTVCPYVSFHKNNALHHKQFHRPKPAQAQHKCEVCPYWIKDKINLVQHMKVHKPGYRDELLGKKTAHVNVAKKTPVKQQPPVTEVSPSKSDISEIDDVVEIAHIKQQIIASKIRSVAVTPCKVRPESALYSSVTGGDTLSSVIVEKKSMVPSSYKKYHQCQFCPWTNVRNKNLLLHEKMHSDGDARRKHKCMYCTYHCSSKSILAQHIKVHSIQYRPGLDMVNDVEDLHENTDDISDEPETDISLEGILTKLDQEETLERLVEAEGEKLDTSALPNKQADYYLKYSGGGAGSGGVSGGGTPILEKAVLRKWCCEKCPYATMKKAQFEKHVLLHASKQRYVCQYCDYSVPTYHLLLEHEKLHLLPNPNLLHAQSISNLMRLPDIPADIAAAAGYTIDEPGNHDHMKSLYENSTGFTEPKKLYYCDRCPYNVSKRGNLLGHLKFHMIRSEHKCPYCDYSVRKQNLLKQHIKLHFNVPGCEMNGQAAVKGELWEVPQVDSDKMQVLEEDENENMVVNSKQDENGGGGAGVGENLWVCRFCDRCFNANLKLSQHEQLHLLGVVVH